MKPILTGYLATVREAVVWKLDGIGERAARMPLTPTGSNILGIVKHLGAMEFGYFGDVFGRPVDEPMAVIDEAVLAVNGDMWADEDQDIPAVRAFYTRSVAFANTTIEARDLDAPGLVPWWPPERQNVTLGRILVHVIVETARHAGHLDILREQSDGQVGMYPDRSGLDAREPVWWEAYTARLRDLAARAGE
jgi:hypothetical protein